MIKIEYCNKECVKMLKLFNWELFKRNHNQ